MLSREQLDHYRRMTPGERMALSLKMTAEHWSALMGGSADQVDRKFELINRENNLRNANMLAAFELLNDQEQDPPN